MKLINSLMIAASLAAPVMVQACQLTPGQFVEADIASRQATVDGMKIRLQLLQSEASTDQKLAADDNNRQQVDAAFELYGCNINQFLHFASTNAQQINQYLDDNSLARNTLADIQTEFDAISVQIAAIKQNTL